MTVFFVGMKFPIDEYANAYDWVEKQNKPYYSIKEIGKVDGVRMFEIVDLTPTAEEIEKEKQELLENEFFNTSLGYVRRKVTMKSGAIKDFLADILPILTVGVPVLTYTSEFVQKKVLVTETFINECKQQVLKDFYGV